MSFTLKNLCSNLIPVGKYKMQVTDIKFAAGGSKSILINLTVAEGPYAKRVHTETIPEKAYSFRLMPFLKACKVDVDREFGTAEEMYKFAFASAKNKIIMADMGIRTYNETDYNNITDFSPLPDSTVSAEEVAESFGTTPEVKGNTLDGMVEEENHSANAVPATAEEPELDINLDDLENPF